MSYDINKIKERCIAICAKVGVEFKIPVSINGRLTRTLGRVQYTRNSNGYVTSVSMEISKQLIDTQTDEVIESVIDHECAHYLVNETTHAAHGHDEVFRMMCARIGCTNDGRTTKEFDPTKVLTKYTVICENCGPIANYHRMSSTLRHLDLCRCKKCGGHKLKLIQNY